MSKLEENPPAYNAGYSSSNFNTQYTSTPAVPAPYPPQTGGTMEGAGYPAGPPVVVPVTTTIAPASVNYRGVLRQVPGRVQCQFCGQEVLTVTTKKAGLITYASCGLVAAFGGCLGCCLIPFCIDACKDTIHACPNCDKTIYIYNTM